MDYSIPHTATVKVRRDFTEGYLDVLLVGTGHGLFQPHPPEGARFIDPIRLGMDSTGS